VRPHKGKKKKKSKRPVRPKTAGSKSARRQTPNVRVHTVGKKSIGDLFEDLVAVQSRLRAPGGCPWDREQTHATLKTYLIEEAYEVLDALENGNSNELAEELGDLLLQVLFHADLARESGTFDISNVVTGIHDKMIRRHPHVFGNVKAETSSEVLKNWAQLKAAEKQFALREVEPEIPQVPSVLDGIPRSLPALLEAYQLTRRAAQVGFDWETIDGIFEKMREEISELRVELEASKRRAAEEEVGDILFVAVNLARFLGLDPEVALKHSNLKFKSRFQEIETKASRSGQRLAQLSKEELEILWEAAKARSKTSTPAGNGE
jgi:tetrapyrrole methylase family protein / MazG family protein